MEDESQMVAAKLGLATFVHRGDRHIIHPYLSAIEGIDASDQVQQRGLARSRGTGDADEFTIGDGKRNIAQCADDSLPCLVGAYHMLNPDHRDSSSCTSPALADLPALF
ncbi:hypothetical protein SDC9_190739 [bioreactor metagenome]|uniref:Uncharacterized protein n=1 Tax=bioreactor metagenome TaxID=1076179 RepID=A0A645HWD8_9ZZZZ